jgi:hypothetical protein
MTSVLKSIVLMLSVYNAQVLASAPFGEPVNCRTINSQIAIYEGTASCWVRSDTPPYNSVEVREYVFGSPVSQRYITSYIAGRYYSCWATVPFSHYQQVTRQECQYKPVAEFHDGMPKVNSFSVLSSSRDYDGSIVGYQWIVDGVSFSTAASITLPYKNGQTSTYQIQLTVTDNDGYTNSSARSITVKNDECRTQACRNR